MTPKVEFPITVLSDLHVGHPASYLTDPAQLAPLCEGAATVLFNGDTVEALWVCNRDKAHGQLEQIAATCQHQGARAIFLNGNHDPVVSSASHLDLCDGAILVTHGDILFHAVAPWSREAEVIGAAHSRVLDEMADTAGPDALTVFEERLVAVKKASLALEMHEPRRPGGRLAGLALALRESWPPWRLLNILHSWLVTPDRADALAHAFRPRARFVLLGHTHYAGVWKRGQRVIINTGSFLPFSGRYGVRLSPDRLDVLAIERRKDEWRFGRAVATFEVSRLEKVKR